MNEMLNGVPAIVIHFDQSGNVTREEKYNMENFEITDLQAKAFAQAILPAIKEFYSHEENIRAFEEWESTQICKGTD